MMQHMDVIRGCFFWTHQFMDEFLVKIIPMRVFYWLFRVLCFQVLQYT